MASLIFLGSCLASGLIGFFVLSHYGRAFRLLMLMRVPLVFAAAGFGLPIVTAITGLTVLRNFFILERPQDLYAVALLAILNSWLCGLCWLLVWEYGFERIGEPARKLPRFWAERRLLRILPFTVLAGPLFWLICREAQGVRWQIPIALAVATSAGVFVLLSVVRQVLISNAHLDGRTRWGQRIWSHVPQSLAAGYFDPARQKAYPGHGTAAAFFFLLILAYLYGEVFLDPRLMPQPPLPALAYLLMLSMLMVSLLSGAAFFFDRYRVPLLGAILGWYAMSYIGPETDHTFIVYSLTDRPVPMATAPAAVAVWTDQQARRIPPVEKPPLVVICASGGGIQASAWTTRVVTWLMESLESQQPGLGQQFGRSVRFVSSTSGGSVGSLYVWEAWRRYGPEMVRDRQILAAVRAAGSRSSLAETGWGLVYPDFQRAFFPLAIDARVDRAWAMEQAWKRSLSADQPLTARLSDWATAAAQGKMPAVAMNAFLIETGDRLLLSNVDLQGTRRARTFARLYGREPSRNTEPVSTNSTDDFPLSTAAHTVEMTVDLDMISAARLSATFPYVTPIARADWAEVNENDYRLPPHHVSDGGYFDNFGVLAAVEWIQDVLTSTHPLADRPLAEFVGPVVLIEIRAFGTEELEGAAQRESRQKEIVGWVSECEASAETWGDPAAVPTTGWRNALIGPADGLLKMRSSTQVARNETEVRMLRQLFPGRITHLVFQPVKGDWPFSWHMSPADIAALDAHQQSVQDSPARHALARILLGQQNSRSYPEQPAPIRPTPPAERDYQTPTGITVRPHSPRPPRH